MSTNADLNHAANKQTNLSASGRILVVDHELQICELLAYNLDNEGFDVDTVQTTDEVKAIDIRNYRLIIIDTNTPGATPGLDIVRQIKTNPETGNIPVIICTTLDSDEDIVTGLNAGADNYLVKPFSLRVLLAQMRSLLRRCALSSTSVTTDAILTFKSLQVDLVTRNVTIDDMPIGLTRTEYDILVLFMKNINRTFNRNEIYAAAWPSESIVTERAIDTNISRLRKKIGAELGSHIVNRSGIGYGLMEMQTKTNNTTT